MEIESFRGRRVLVVLPLTILLAVGVGLLVGKAAGYAKLLASLRGASVWWLAVCFAGEVVSYAGYVLALRGTVRFDGGPDLGRRAGTVVVFAGLGATRLLAAAGAGGLALLYWVLRRAGVQKDESIVRVLALNTLLYGSLGAGVWLAALALAFGTGGGAPLAMTLPWLAVVPCCVLAAAWVSVPRRAASLAERRRGSLPRRAFASAVGGVVFVRRLTRRDAGATLGSCLYWAGDAFCLWAGLRAFGVDLSAAAVVLAYGTGYVANLLPLPTGGVGGVDAAMTFALTAVGVPLAPALLGVFAYRFFSFWLPTIPGAAALAALPTLGRELAGRA